MIERFDIAGYARISVDEELDRDNVSIENQKSIIEDFVTTHFPNSTLTFFEDRDRSGYTFGAARGVSGDAPGADEPQVRHSHRQGFLPLFAPQLARTGRSWRICAMRVCVLSRSAITSTFRMDDDWLKIQFQFLINEMPVTDTSKKGAQRREAAAGGGTMALRRAVWLYSEQAAGL